MEKVKLNLFRFVFFISLFLTCNSFASVEINRSGIYRLKDYFSSLHDPSGKLEYPEIKDREFSDKIQGGFFKGSVWSKAEVCNMQPKPIYFLYKDLIDSIEIYSDQFTQPVQHKFAGRNKLADHFWVLLELPITGCTTVYVRFTAGDVFNLNTFIVDQESFSKIELNYVLFYAFFYSVVLLILVLSFIFFFKTKDSLYFWFALLVVFQDVLGASLLNGFLFRFVMPADYFIKYDVGNFFAPIMNIALVVFAHKFVANKYKVLEWVSGIFVLVQILVVAPIVVNFLYPVHVQNIVTSEIVNTSILLSCFWVLVVSLVNYRNPNSWFFILASGPKVLGSFIKTLLLQGDISESFSFLGFDMGFVVYNIGVLGSLMEAVVITATLVLSYFRNIEEKSKALQLTSEKLKAAEMEAELVSTYKQVAHDIRSPLSALQVLTLNKEKIPVEFANVLSLAIERIKEIAADLNKKGNDSSSKKQPVTSCELVKLITDLLEEKSAEFGQRGKLLIDMQHNLSSVNQDDKFEIDTIALKRAISNLLNNAAEASDFSGSINVTIEFLENNVEFVIRDSGKGMNADTIEKLGTKGFSFGKSELESAGTGLGYHHALGVVHQHGGTINVQSKEGIGTTIIIRLKKAP